MGEAAKHIAPENPAQAIFDVKRLMGRAFADPVVQKERKQMPSASACHVGRREDLEGLRSPTNASAQTTDGRNPIVKGSES